MHQGLSKPKRNEVGVIQYAPIDEELKKKIEIRELIHEMSIGLMVEEFVPEKLATSFD